MPTGLSNKATIFFLALIRKNKSWAGVQRDRILCCGMRDSFGPFLRWTFAVGKYMSGINFLFRRTRSRRAAFHGALSPFKSLPIHPDFFWFAHKGLMRTFRVYGHNKKWKQASGGRKMPSITRVRRIAIFAMFSFSPLFVRQRRRLKTTQNERLGAEEQKWADELLLFASRLQDRRVRPSVGPKKASEG